MNVERLERIKQLVLAEPKRADMASWARQSAAAPCRTAGCIAGWDELMDLKFPGRSKLMRLVAEAEDAMAWEFDEATERLAKYIMSRSARRLDLEEDEARRLFLVSGWPERFESRLVNAMQGTPRYARVIVQRIDHFIKTKGAE